MVGCFVFLVVVVVVVAAAVFGILPPEFFKIQQKFFSIAFEALKNKHCSFRSL